MDPKTCWSASELEVLLRGGFNDDESQRMIRGA